MTIRSLSRLVAAALLGACLAGCASSESPRTDLGRRVNVAQALAAPDHKPAGTGVIMLGAGDGLGTMVYGEYLARARSAEPVAEEVVFQGPPDAVDPAE